MDYQYIYSVVNGSYVVLLNKQANDNPMPSGVLDELARYSTNYASQQLGIPEEFGFFSMDGKNGTKLLTLSKSQRKVNCTSLAKMAQQVGWIISDKFAKEQLAPDFGSLIDFGFYSEAQVDEFAASGAVPAFGSGAARGAAEPVEVFASEKAIRTILCAVFSRWLRGTAPIKIGVPEKYLDRYSSYVLSAVKEIYSYFPAALRIETGFVSYLQPGTEKNFPRYSIIFVPASMAEPSTVFLDDSNPSAYELLPNKTNRVYLNSLIEHLVSLKDPEVRREAIGSIFEKLENSLGEISKFDDAKQYVSYGIFCAVKSAGSLVEALKIRAGLNEKGINCPDKLKEAVNGEIQKKFSVSELEAYLGQLRSEGADIGRLIAELTDIAEICKGSEESLGIVFDRLSQLVREENSRCSEEESVKIFNELKNRQPLLAAASEEKSGAVVTEAGEFVAMHIGRRTTESVCRTQFTAPTQYVRETDEVISAAIRAAEPYLKTERLEDFAARLLGRRKEEACRPVNNKLDAILARPQEQTADIRLRLGEISSVESEIAGLEVYEEVRARIETLRAEFNGKLNASNAKVRDIAEKLAGEKNYFHLLELAAKEIDGEPKEVAEGVRGWLQSFDRPTAAAAYLDAFEKSSGTAMTQKKLLRLPSAVQKWILEDISRLGRGTVKLEPTGRSISALQRRVSELGDIFGDRLGFSVGEYEYSRGELLKALAFDGNGQNDGKKLSSLCRNLFEAKVFKGRHISSVAEMLEASGESDETILDLLLKANIDAATEGHYLAAIRHYRERAGLKPEEIRAKIEEKTDKASDAAYDACKAYLRELPRPKKERADSGKGLSLPAIIAIALAAALLVGGATFFGFQYFRGGWPFEPEVIEEPVVAPEPRIEPVDGVLDLSACGKAEPELSALIASYFVSESPAGAEPAVYDNTQLLTLYNYPTTLRLSNNQLAELSSLANAYGIRELYLDNNPALQSLDAIAGLQQLKVVDVRDTALSEAALENFCSVHPGCFVISGTLGNETVRYNSSVYTRGDREWNLRGQGMEGFDILFNPVYRDILSGASQLDLRDNPDLDLAGIEQLGSLDIVLAGGEGLDADYYNSLMSLADITYLRVSDDSLSPDEKYSLGQFAAAQGLVLTVEPATYNAVPIGTSYYDIDSESLDLSGKNLVDEDLVALQQFANLKHLDLSGNSISDIRALERIKTLRSIDISDNFITDISALRGLPNLTELYADGNGISALNIRRHEFAQLRVLSLGGNLIEDYSSVRELANLEILLIDSAGQKPGLEEALPALEKLRLIQLSDSDMLSPETSDFLYQRGVKSVPAGLVRGPEPVVITEPALEAAAEGTAELAVDMAPEVEVIPQ